MPNNLLNNPILINTAMSSSSYQSSLPAINHRPYLRVRKIQWSGQIAGASFTIEDGHGNIWFQGFYDSADQSYDFATPMTWADFQVTQLTSGTLSIFLA
jgi:hypothetical protein